MGTWKKAILLMLLPGLLLCSATAQILMISASKVFSLASESLEVTLEVTPEYPFPWDEVNVTVSFTTPTYDEVDFGETTQVGNTFHVSITIWKGVMQVVTTHTHTYHLGKLPADSYEFLAHFTFFGVPPRAPWNESVMFTVDAVHVISYVFVCYGYTFQVTTTSNSTISALEFTPEEKQISFNVDGPSGSIGFCNVTIPKDMLDGEFQVLIDEDPLEFALAQNTTHSFLHFTYNHFKYAVKIIGAAVVEPPLPKVIRVPDDYLTIQEAVDAASWGDTIQVASGTYYEHVSISKPLTLIGESRNTTVIDGNGTGSVFHVTSNHELVWVGCTLSEFTICNGNYGVELLADENTIGDSIIVNNRYGIQLDSSNNNTVIGNTIINNNQIGIHSWESTNNVIYHNNFISNKWWQVLMLLSPNNVWDNGYPSGGNFWSDYTGEDLDGDGIGDTSYGIGGAHDRYPLMVPYILGDVNRDGFVNIFDLLVVRDALASEPGHPNWNPLADVNGDGYINIFDLLVVRDNLT